MVKKLNTDKPISLVTLPWIRLIWIYRPSTALEIVKFFENPTLDKTNYISL